SARGSRPRGSTSARARPAPPGSLPARAPRGLPRSIRPPMLATSCSACSQRPPLPPPRFNQTIRVGRPPASGGIRWTLSRLLFRPAIENRRDPLPRGFHAVAAHEEGRVASHDVEQQAFVSLRGARAEGASVAKIHVHGIDLHARAGDLGRNAERK